MKLDNLDLIIGIIVIIVQVFILYIIIGNLIKKRKTKIRYYVISWILIFIGLGINSYYYKIEDYIRIKNPKLFSKFETIEDIKNNKKYILYRMNKEMYEVSECEIKDDVLIIYKNTLQKINTEETLNYQYKKYKEVREVVE